MVQELVMIGGMAAAGKTTLVKRFTEQGYSRLNRDTAGGSLDDLLPKLDILLSSGKDVVMDNLYPTRESRAKTLALAKKKRVPVRFVLMDTTLEDCQFNACLRMMDKYGKVLRPEDHQKAPYKGDPNMVPVVVLYKYRKEFQAPEKSEGFVAVEVEHFKRIYPADWTSEALIFDFDGTLRTHVGNEKFPCKPSEVRAILDRGVLLRRLAKLVPLLGASNQSGVAKGKLTASDAEACFDETLKQLGVKFQEVRYCPHKVPPITCYCRKPGCGMGVELIVRYHLDPRKCVYVGDQTTDATFAKRCGFRFQTPEEFFQKK